PILGLSDLTELRRDCVDRLFPRDAPKLPASFRPRAHHWILEPVRMVDPLEIAGHLLTKEAISERMLLIPLELHSPAILDRDNHAARVRAIMRADGPYNPCFAHGIGSWQTIGYRNRSDKSQGW